MKKGNRMICLTLFIALIASGTAFAGESSIQTDGDAWLRPDVNVELRGQTLQFKDENGEVVYPIVYKGGTYLPLRAVSGLMREPIEWVGSAKSIFIGRTITNPAKTLAKSEKDSPYIAVTAQPTKGTPTAVTVYTRSDINIFHDFNQVKFKDESGIAIEPLWYNGSTYLPLRAVAELMNGSIEWNEKTKTVVFKAAEEPEQTTVSENCKKIEAVYNTSSAIYNDVTAAISKMALMKPEEKIILAETMSKYYANTTLNAVEAKTLPKLSGLTEEETTAAEAVYQFAAVLEQYVLLTENISYLAATDRDYSMLAESFLNTALNTESASNVAVKAVENLLGIKPIDENPE